MTPSEQALAAFASFDLARSAFDRALNAGDTDAICTAMFALVTELRHPNPAPWWRPAEADETAGAGHMIARALPDGVAIGVVGGVVVKQLMVAEAALTDGGIAIMVLRLGLPDVAHVYVESPSAHHLATISHPLGPRPTRQSLMPGGGVCRCLHPDSPVVCDGCEGGP